MQKILLANTGNYALVDDEDYDFVMSFGKWHENDSGYVVKRGTWNGRRSTIRMHIVINETPKRLHTDHINGNRLDNRRSNLRSVSSSINAWNSSRESNRKYALYLPKGIAWDATRGQFIATKIVRKRFKTLEEAKAYKEEQELLDYDNRRLKPELPTGVFKNKSNKGYQAKLVINGVRHYLGTFPTIEEARNAYLERKRGLAVSQER